MLSKNSHAILPNTLLKQQLSFCRSQTMPMDPAWENTELLHKVKSYPHSSPILVCSSGIIPTLPLGILYTERKLKNNKGGRPGNEAQGKTCGFKPQEQQYGHSQWTHSIFSEVKAILPVKFGYCDSPKQVAFQC